MKIFKTFAILTLISTNSFAAELSTGNKAISHTKLDEINHTGNLKITDSTIKNINNTGNLQIKDSTIQTIKNVGNFKIKHSDINSIKQTGNTKLKDIKLKTLIINGNLKIIDSEIETIECLDQCLIKVKKSTVKEIKFKKEKGAIEADKESKISKLTNCTILNEKDEIK